MEETGGGCRRMKNAVEGELDLKPTQRDGIIYSIESATETRNHVTLSPREDK